MYVEVRVFLRVVLLYYDTRKGLAGRLITENLVTVV